MDAKYFCQVPVVQQGTVPAALWVIAWENQVTATATKPALPLRTAVMMPEKSVLLLLLPLPHHKVTD